MDLAYDHIQEEIFAGNDPTKKASSANGDSNSNTNTEQPDLQTEIQETFRAFQASPWGARIGGLWDNVRKQGESYYEGARQEAAAAGEEAVKGFEGLKDSIVGHTRNLSLNTEGDVSGTTGEDRKEREREKDEATTPKAEDEEHAGGGAGETGNNMEGFLARFKAEASKRLKEIEKAEDAADEAILRFGLNVRQKLRDAVSIIPPEESPNKVLFESKDAEGKRVIHATRFEAQLHVIHSNLENFSKDPVSDQWLEFKKEFNVDGKTEAIAADLEAHPELRTAMEKLVPETVEYADFWARYYFLRLVVETEEQKRKELLKGANVNEEEEVTWDDDSESESETPVTPQAKSDNKTKPASSETAKSQLTPNERRPSNDQHSQPDSESSYDVVSGAPSRTTGSPKEKSVDKADESDEDWE